MSFAAVQEAKSSAETITSLLPVAAIAVPLSGALLVYLAGLWHEKLRNACAILTSLLTLLVVLALYPLVLEGQVVYRLAEVMEYGLFLRVDFLGFLFATTFAGSWLLATVYATVYMKSEHAQNRFYIFLLSTLGNCLGVVLAGDLFSLFLFFELMTFSSYVLVIHRQTEGALRAGAVAIYMGVAGGLSLLMAMFLLLFAVGSLEIRPMLEEIMASGVNPLLVIVLFLVGFGIKLGLVPLHIWLPRAYEEAPTPVNVISSAAMLKAGAYGLLRVLTMIFTPATPGANPAAEHLMSSVGYAIIWLGIVTMLAGAMLAILQDNAKRMLGCSSISQMGYVLMGIGVAAFLGVEKGAVGYTGALYHVLNHSVFKAALFMMVGIVFLNTGEVALSRVRGMMSKLPFVSAMFLVAYAGIAGIPGLNGYASKTLLHHAIVDAYKYGHAGSLLLAERIFMLASALTVVYFAKLFYRLFLGRVRPEHRQLQFKAAPLHQALLAIYAAAIFYIGLFPAAVLNRFVIPATVGFSFDYASVKYLGNLNFWVVKDLQSAAVVLIMAAVLFVAFDHYRVFDWQPPEWLSVEKSIYLPLAGFLLKLCCYFGVTFDSAVNRTYLKSGELASGACRYISSFDSSLDNAYEKTGGTARHMLEQTARFDGAISEAYENSGLLTRRLADSAGQADDTLDDLYEQSGYRSRSLWDRMRGRPSDWNIKSLNFDSFLIALMLGLFLFLLVYHTRIR